MNIKKTLICICILTLCTCISACGKINSLNSTLSPNSSKSPSVDSTTKVPSDDTSSVPSEEKIDLTQFDELILGNTTNMISGNGRTLSDETSHYYSEYNNLKYYVDADLDAIRSEYSECEGGSEPQEMYDRIDAAKKTLISDMDCYNLNFYNDKLVFSNDKGKVFICDKTGDNLVQITQLDNYNVKCMYVVQNKYILFQSEGNVYQYNIDTQAIVDYKKTDVVQFIPTTYGMIYIYPDNENIKIFAEDSFKIDSVHSKYSVCTRGNYLTFTFTENTGVKKMITLDALFNDYSQDKIEDFDIEKTK